MHVIKKYHFDDLTLDNQITEIVQGVNPPIKETPLTLENNCTVYGGGTIKYPSYYMDTGGRVHLSGMVMLPNPFVINTTICVLPVGFRPLTSLTFGAAVHSGVAYVPTAVVVDYSGAISLNQAISANGAWISLDGISFLANR